MHEFFCALSRHADVTPERTAIVVSRQRYAFGTLFARITAAAAWAASLPQRIAVLCGSAADYVLADLALTYAGKELVPLPAFFSDDQLRHIVRSAQLTHVVTDTICRERDTTLGLLASGLGAASPSNKPAANSRRIVFTSGSTGKPEGVQLSARQMMASVTALADATGATAGDRYLSLLPSELLLEQVAGLYLPLLVGAAIYLTDHSASGNRISITDAVATAGATVTVLTPELLSHWLDELATLETQAPKSLRFVAVGGAMVAGQLLTKAQHRGLPVRQGYGLTECCSVVSVNRPDKPGCGTAGRPIAGVDVDLRDEELIVSGPTVMDGYLDRPPIAGNWPTGDIGSFDRQGRLVIKGRKDNIIVTSTGRNISPEWIEGMIAADWRIGRCVVAIMTDSS